MFCNISLILFHIYLSVDKPELMAVGQFHRWNFRYRPTQIFIIAKSKCATFSIEMYTKTPFKEYLKGAQNINTFYPSSELYNLQTVQKRTKGN